VCAPAPRGWAALPGRGAAGASDPVRIAGPPGGSTEQPAPGATSGSRLRRPPPAGGEVRRIGRRPAPGDL